ncbi:MAG: inositol monophosphatase family protein [Gemmatimonadota bacterium]
MEFVRSLLETAVEAARAAGEIHRSFAGRVALADATEKGPSDFVSHVDLRAQAAASEVILTNFPDHRILSEEEAPADASPAVVTLTDLESAPPEGPATPPLWIVDPLDGTTNFLHGHPLYAASVGVTVAGRPVAGAVAAVASDECWWAAKGEGAFRNGVRIRSSQVRTAREALVGTGFPFKRMAELPRFLRQMQHVLPATSGIRRGGSAALDLCFLAQGSLDAFWECHLEPWDVAAGLIILEEAGGMATRIGGGALEVRRPGSVLAGNSEELMQVLDALLAAAESGDDFGDAGP